MSGDTQPKKRKDKKRKKDDEDMVKETTVHAPKQHSAGAAQSTKDPSDVQMHIHSDHGTGGHWCAKVVFFILLAGLGALIGLIIMENQGVSNDDTPLSESRYSEFFNGWVDETRQDDHHHEEILAAINSLDDHDDHDDGGAEHAVEDHGDGHDQDDGEDDDHDDGAPYAEQEDHDDDEEQVQDEDDDDEGAAQKLDDDEVEEIFAQQEAAARQEAFAQAQREDDDDNDDQDEDGDDQDDDEDDNEPEVVNARNTNNLDDDDDDDGDNDDEVAETIAKEIDGIADDQDETPFVEEDEDDDGDEDEIEEVKRGSEQLSAADSKDDDDDDDDADDDGNNDDFNDFVDNDGGEEEYLAKLRSEQQRRAEAEEERKAAAEPEEETSLTVKIFVGVALLGAAHLLLTSPRAPTKKSSTGDMKVKVDNATASSATPSFPRIEQKEIQTATTPPTTVKSVMDDFIVAGPTEQLSNDNADVIEGNVIILDEIDDPERYSGDEYDYEMEDLEEELEEVEAEEDEEEEKHLIKKEQEIGAFVPITFEEFNSMYRPPPEMAELIVEQQHQQQLQQHDVYPEAEDERDQHTTKKVTQESLLARKKPPKGAVNKLIYGLHKDPIVIPTDEEREPTTSEAGENVSAKGEAKSVLTALLSEIPSPPIDIDHEFDKLVPSEFTIARPTTEAGALQQRPAMVSMGGSVYPVREKHVEFLLPEKEPEFELEPEPLQDSMMEWSIPATDNGSKENLFVPDASEEEMEPHEYAEEYGQYEGEEEEDIVYEDEEELDDIESVLLNQYGSDEEEEPLTDDNIPPGGDDDEASDVDDSDLMRRLEQKYGKLPAAASATTATAQAEAASPDGDDDEAAAAGWTKIPTRAEEADRSYQQELRRAQQQLDEEFGFE
uniref:Uncharacterized protein n=1 Tax=Anopheles atroparvus TaxID=41427 RepID=A0AAG5DG74_ANOAO